MSKRGFIIGQAPPKVVADVPFGRTKLYAWFESVGVTREEVAVFFDFDALVADFPGSGPKGHLAPSPEKMSTYRPTLSTQIRTHDYRLIIPVGKMAIHEVLQSAIPLEEAVGTSFYASPFGSGESRMIIPLPHPSGASTWAYKPANKIRLEHALSLIARELREKI